MDPGLFDATVTVVILDLQRQNEAMAASIARVGAADRRAVDRTLNDIIEHQRALIGRLAKS